MGLNLESWSTAAGGAVEGAQAGADYISGRNEEARKQQAERERLDQEALRKQALEAMSELPGLLKPQDMTAPIAPVPPQGGIPVPGPAAAPPTAAPQGGGALPGGGMGPPEAPQGAALPAEQAPPPPSRRDQMANWHERTRAIAMRAGGLTAVKDLDEYYFTNVKGQMFEYGKGAVEAMMGEGMNAKDTVGAAKLLNTALELAPVDTGLTFRSVDGKLIGSRGNSEREYSAEEIAGMLEQQVLSPKNYLDFQKQFLEERKQDETERGALIGEGQKDTQLGISQQNADATTMQTETYADESDTRKLLRKAQSYAALAGGKAALTRASAAGGEEGLAWNETNILKIEELEETVREGKLGFGAAWFGEDARGTQLISDTIGAAKEIRVANAPDAMTHNDAATLARMAYFDQLPEDVREVPGGLADVVVMTDDSGNFAVRYKGKVFVVPPEVATRINLNKQNAGE